MARKDYEELMGYPLRYTRRRYGRKWFTWVDVLFDGEWVTLGDPWPSTNVSRSQIEDGIKYLEEMAVPPNMRDTTR
jgi:hypothetical protein